MTKHKRRLRLESQVNPFATQQHHARSMMYLIQARASPDTYLSFTFTFTFLSFIVARDGVSIFLQQRHGAGRFPHHGTVPTLKPGGTLVVLWRLIATPTKGIIRPVHRAYL